MTTPAHPDDRPPEDPADQELSDEGAVNAGAKAFPIPKLNVASVMDGRWPLEMAWAKAHARMAICSMKRADQPGPDDLECFYLEAPSGSTPIELRMADLLAVMQLPQAPSSTGLETVPFTIVKSPLRLLEQRGRLGFPCFKAQGPRYGSLVAVDTEQMFVAFVREGNEPVEHYPPRDVRFIAIPSMEPAPAQYRHLGLVEADDQWWRLYCPDLHIPPLQMEWSGDPPPTGQAETEGSDQPST